MSCSLSVSHALGSERGKQNPFDVIDKIFENLNSISNIFQDPHDFLIFTELVMIDFFSRNSQPKVPRKKVPTDVFLSRGTPILKITEMGFGIFIKYF